MYHSITFGNKNTWEDWHLVPSSRPVFNPPALKEKYLDIPGGDGNIDLTEALTGYPVYQNRTGSVEFIVMNDYWPWQEAYSAICDYIHGQRMKAVLEDDPDYYYEGRFKVNKWKSDKDYSKITIDYNVSPYKKRHDMTVLTFPVGAGYVPHIIRKDIYGRAPSCPQLIVQTIGDASMAIKFVNTRLGINVTKTVNSGTHRLPDMVLYGDKVTVSAKVENVTMVLADSSGGVILDSRGNPVLDTPNGQLDIYCEYGGL